MSDQIEIQEHTLYKATPTMGIDKGISHYILILNKKISNDDEFVRYNTICFSLKTKKISDNENKIEFWDIGLKDELNADNGDGSKYSIVPIEDLIEVFNCEFYKSILKELYKSSLGKK